MKLSRCTIRAIRSSSYYSTILNSSIWIRSCTTAALFPDKQDASNQQKYDPRRDILKASLKHVNRKGWTTDALVAGAIDCSMPPVAHGMFPRGAAEIAEYWITRGNESLKEHMQKLLSELKLKDQNMHQNIDTDRKVIDWEQEAKELVISGLHHRLMHTVPFLRSWPQAMALGLRAQNATKTFQLLSEIVDIICFHAGPKGYENEWFSRRNAIGAIYASAELYMLTDYSEGYEDTRDFVRRGIQNSLQLEQLIQHRAGNMSNVQGASNILAAAAIGVESIATAAASMVFPAATQVARNISKQSGGKDSTTTVKDLFRDIHSSFEKIAEVTGNTPLQSVLARTRYIFTQDDLQTRDQKGDTSSYRDEEVEVTEGMGTLKTVSLPDGFSLFGLVSMNAEEAVKMVEENNEGFKVIVWPAEESFEPIKRSNIVRLLVNKDNIVVDVWRN